MIYCIMLEWAFKIIAINAIILAAFGLLRWKVSHHINVGDTFSNFFKGTVEPSGIVTYDPNMLYQNGESVADIVGTVEQSETGVLFRRLTNTGNLDREATFQYGHRTLRLIRYGSYQGMLIEPPLTVSNVLNDVEFEYVE